MAFATTDDLGNVLGREIDSEDASALAALDAATAVVQAYTGQTLTAVSNDELTLDGNGTRVLVLPQLPVTSVDSIEVDGEALDAAEYQWSADGYLRRVGSNWPTDLRSVVVVYDHGYASIPDLVVAITAQLAARLYESPAAVKQETIGAYSVTYTGGGTGLHAGETMLLDQYRGR